MSEDEIECNHHDREVRLILRTPGRSIPLRTLFELSKYPPDVMVLYAEGYSVTNFLVARSNRFGGNNDFLYAVGVSADGSIVAAGGQEGVVRLYNGNSAQLIKTLLPPGVTEAQPKK